MVDAALGVWLIEVNSNPCLELACPYLGAIIPRLLEHVMQVWHASRAVCEACW
jgi:hypothetical protein